MSPVELAKVRKELDEYLSKGWIRPSTSPCGSLILFARVKDRILRICTDYRALNQQTRPDKYPLPRIGNLPDQLVNVHCLSSIDLYTGCY